MRWSGSASVTLLAAGIVVHGTRVEARSPGGGDAGAGGAADAAAEPGGGASGVPASEALRLRAAAFSRFHTPVRGAAQSIGAYANGCVLGAATLPISGPNFEVLHLQRHRRYGHPNLVAFITRLAQTAKKQNIGPLLIGDLSQPRGGPTPNGHRSHQTGLDVDIGFTRQAWLLHRRPTAEEREEVMPPAVVDLKTRTLTPAWGPKVERLLELAARDSAVERIFVNPHVKEALCKEHARNRAAVPWLRVLRPWTFHHDHLHVRLKCPPGSPACDAQAAVGPGDGCDEADRWIADELRRLQPQPPVVPPVEPRPPPPPPPLPPLPAACQALLDDQAGPGTSARGRRAARDP
jgi:penicillin-insensitive murein endopeptidase